MSVEEKFARATRTSHLKHKRLDEEPGDAERIQAAGAVQTQHKGESHKDAQERSLGVLLARLRAEWDSISKTDRAAAQYDQTARILLLLNLRSLGPAKQAMLNFALAKAEGKGNASPALKAAQAEAWKVQELLATDLTQDERKTAIVDHALKVRAVVKAADAHQAAIARLVQQVMDAWLDRLCAKCSGRGFTGGYDKLKTMCPGPKQGGCAGTGSKRLGRFGTTDAEQFFALWLLGSMDSKVSGSMGQMARKQRDE